MVWYYHTSKALQDSIKPRGGATHINEHHHDYIFQHCSKIHHRTAVMEIVEQHIKIHEEATHWRITIQPTAQSQNTCKPTSDYKFNTLSIIYLQTMWSLTNKISLTTITVLRNNETKIDLSAISPAAYKMYKKLWTILIIQSMIKTLFIYSTPSSSTQGCSTKTVKNGTTK